MIIDATDYGASPSATWQQNRDAINAAINAAHATGGGTVLLPPGDLTVKGIIQKAHVTIAFHSTRLVHPDGNSGHIIASDVNSTTGNIAAGSRTLTVAFATGIDVGGVVAVRGAGGRNEAAIWELANAIDATQTTGITLAAPLTGLATSGGYLIISSEIIAYTSATDGILAGVSRGALGTAAAAHDAGAWIGQSIRLYARVEAVDGATVTLDRAAVLGVTDAAIDVGPAGLAITGLARFYGNRPQGGSASPTYPIAWTYVGGGKIEAIEAERCEAAVILERGSMGCQIGAISAHECGNAPVKGSVVWLFRSASNNEIGPVTATGADIYTGVYIDDRTSIATEYDGPCNENVIGPINIKRPFSGSTAPADGIGINITGSGRNVIAGLIVNGLRFPIVIAGQSQNRRPDGSANPHTYGNVIYGGAVDNCHRPWSITAPGNTIIGLWWRSIGGLIGDSTAPVTTIGVSAISGEEPNIGRFNDGNKGAPGISFAGDPDTGLYRLHSGDMAFSCDGDWTLRIRTTDLLINDGRNFHIGTGIGTKFGVAPTQKLGFWGKAPIVQPAAISDATDATTTTQLNTLLSALRTAGLIAT